MPLLKSQVKASLKSVGELLNPCDNLVPGQLACKPSLRTSSFRDNNGMVYRCQYEAKKASLEFRTMWTCFPGGRGLRSVSGSGAMGGVHPFVIFSGILYSFVALGTWFWIRSRECSKGNGRG